MTIPYFYPGDNPSGPILVVAHGAAMTHFNKSHILISTIKPYASKIISLDLPGHGKSQLKEKKFFDFETALENMNKILDSAIQSIQNINKTLKIGFIGFSLGGIFGLRMKNPPFDFAIYMGCGTTFNKSSLKKISIFFSENTFRRFNLVESLRKNHGSWQNMLKMVQSWFSLGSKMLNTPIKKMNIPALFILSENDQAFDANSVQYDGNYYTIIIPGDHFSYYHVKLFEVYKNAMIDHIKRYGNS